MSTGPIRHTRNRRNRGGGGRYEKKCSCLQHDRIDNEDYHILACLHNKTRDTYKQLVEKGLLTGRSKWICTSCLDYSQLHFCNSISKPSAKKNRQNTADDNPSSSDAETTDMTNVLDTVLKHLSDCPNTWQSFNKKEQKQLADIATVLGAIIEKDLHDDSKTVSKESNNLTDVNINKNEWLMERNSMLIGFLTGWSKTNVQLIE